MGYAIEDDQRAGAMDVASVTIPLDECKDVYFDNGVLRIVSTRDDGDSVSLPIGNQVFWVQRLAPRMFVMYYGHMVPMRMKVHFVGEPCDVDRLVDAIHAYSTSPRDPWIDNGFSDDPYAERVVSEQIVYLDDYRE